MNGFFHKTAGIVLAVLCFGLSHAQVTSWEVFNKTNSGLPNNRIYTVHVDIASPTVWVGTDNGLARFDGTTWTVWNTSNSPLPNNSVRSIQTDGSGGTWVGTFAGGLVWFKDTTWVIYDPTNSPMPDYFVRSLALDLADGLWIGTTTGLLHKVDTVWHVYNTSNSDLHSNNIASLFSTGADTVWVGTINGGLTHISGEDWFLHTIATTGIGDNSILGVVEDRNGWVWIATPAGGMNRYAGVWAKWNILSSDIPTNSLTSIEIDSTQGHWVGSTDFGLLFKDPLDHFIQVAGPDTFVRCMDYSRIEHVLWTGTNDSGLVKYTLPAVGTKDPATQLYAGIFPNPGSETLWVTCNTPAIASLTDLTGHLLAIAPVTPGNTSIPTGPLPPGMYFLSLRTHTGHSQTLKWLKQ